MQEYPYYTVQAGDTTAYETGYAVELRIQDTGVPLSGVVPQDIVDALKDYFDAMPNVAVSAAKYEVTSTPA